MKIRTLFKEMDLPSQVFINFLFLWLFLLTMIVTVITFSLPYSKKFSFFIYLGLIFLNLVPAIMVFITKIIYIKKIINS